jgi:superfamily II DNA/RNA helicase
MGGTLKGDGYVDDKFIKSNKIERLKEIIEENPRSIVVCRYNNEIKMLEEELKDIVPVYVINGQVNDREDIVKKLYLE